MWEHPRDWLNKGGEPQRTHFCGGKNWPAVELLPLRLLLQTQSRNSPSHAIKSLITLLQPQCHFQLIPSHKQSEISKTGVPGSGSKDKGNLECNEFISGY